MTNRFAAGVLALVASAGVAQATVFNETEGNGSKNTANFFAMTSGDSISGSAAASTTDIDYFRIRTTNTTPSIVLNTLTSAFPAGMRIRGVNNGFVAGDVDYSAAGRSAIKWYTVGTTSDQWVSMARSSQNGTFSYSAALTQTTITPTNAGSYSPGAITLDPQLVGDSEIFLYDGTFTLIAQNDNRAFSDGRALLTQNLPVGTYYFAIGSGNSATAQAFNTSDSANPFFSAIGSGAPTVVLDPGTAAALNPGLAVAQAGSILARSENLGRSATEFSVRINGGNAILATNGTGQALEVAWFTFTVVPGPGAAALLGLGGLAAARRRRA